MRIRKFTPRARKKLYVLKSSMREARKETSDQRLYKCVSRCCNRISNSISGTRANKSPSFLPLLSRSTSHFTISW